MTDPYTQQAECFFDQYQSVSFADVHRSWLRHLPSQPGFAMDVGAGSGRDACALADMGWDVLAVEPSAGLRRLGELASAGKNVQWLDDALPELGKVRALGYRFNLILVSAVWMHLKSADRERAFRILTELMAPGGLLVITLRHGPDDLQRNFYAVSSQELEVLARNRALLTVDVSAQPDIFNRTEVSWQSMVFRLPDDGTGALPLLRHIIVNDDKSSTYKLALLRVITRLADAQPGLVGRRDDMWVELPLGAVALYWIRLYQPLILRHGFRQAGGARGYAFATENFNALKDVSPFDLRIGQILSGALAKVVSGAIFDAAKTIAEMPASKITWPGTAKPVFQAERLRRPKHSDSFSLDYELLLSYGVFRVPALIWDCCSRYACWLDPAIVNEWERLMLGYMGVSYASGGMRIGLQWDEGKRDTTIVRGVVDGLIAKGESVRCVWSDVNLNRQHYQVDHCFPWSRWENNDLWNLMPASVVANAAKSEKLPAAPLMQDSRERIIHWWQQAYLVDARRETFYTEAQAALPLVRESQSLDAVFEGMMQQRLRLKMNQQLTEWLG
ncbi:MAG: class I SAM-dependent methyltransferase [Alcanivoracaceae bacterium]|jgi:SAM-dependent methyltransferase|nr:class I SAM-dependent methyltransferase [Alcanivoracaceae bacterium]